MVPSAAAVIGTRDGAVQVVAVPGEGGVRGDVDLDVEVAGRSAARADLALLGELDPGAGVDTGGDLDGQGAPRADPAVAGALPARVGDDRAEAAAGRAGAQGADLAEERPLDVGDLAGARQVSHGIGWLPGAAPSPWQVVQTTAVSTLSSRADAERRLGEIDLDPDQRVLAAADPRPRSAAGEGRAGRRRTRP